MIDIYDENDVDAVRERMKRFVVAYVAAGNETSIAIYGGEFVGEAAHEAAMLIEFGDNQFAFTTRDARTLANAAESIMGEHLGTPGCIYEGFPNLINMLRSAADAADIVFQDRPKVTLQ